MKSTDVRFGRDRLRWAAHPWLGTVGLLLVTGCSHGNWSSPPPPARTPRAAEAAAPAIPLPAQTPFDGSLELKMVFLESYARGYDLGASNSEYTSAGCLCDAGGDPDRYEAILQGFFAGRKAGASAYKAKAQAGSVAPSR